MIDQACTAVYLPTASRICPGIRLLLEPAVLNRVLLQQGNQEVMLWTCRG